MGSPEHPLEFSQIDAHVYIGTNACCKDRFEAELLAKGVTSDISLEEKHLDMPIGVTEYLWLPTTDHAPLSAAQAQIGVAAIKAMIAAGRKIYIHCKNGHGRGPTLYASYLIKERGMTAAQAVAYIAAKRPTIHLEESQLDFLRSLEAR